MAEFRPLGIAWRKSSASAASNCVEAAAVDGVLVRDSKATQGPILAFGPAPWGMFLDRTRPASDPRR
ncbi:DUF397 domain-containing protein [Embleya sp. NBC_00896]|uniref:DUF397 domain-containing protein n=1 Tax=Embleya sp. NBC_00896 TaxID=2975961 RepID=UPI0038671B02|nr:DUF397 domain-containing protein [Embleya sp. NBC_00896]